MHSKESEVPPHAWRGKKTSENKQRNEPCSFGSFEFLGFYFNFFYSFAPECFVYFTISWRVTRSNDDIKLPGNKCLG